MKATDRSSCVGCKWFRFSPYEPGYSQFTPGADMEIYCDKSKWPDRALRTEEGFRKAMRLSLTCKKFDPIDLT